MSAAWLPIIGYTHYKSTSIELLHPFNSISDSNQYSPNWFKKLESYDNRSKMIVCGYFRMSRNALFPTNNSFYNIPWMAVHLSILYFNFNIYDIDITDKNAGIIWLKSYPDNKYIAYLGDLYPNLIDLFQQISKIYTRHPKLDEMQPFFMKICGYRSFQFNAKEYTRSDKFDKFYKWFVSICYIIKDLAIYYEQKDHPLTGLFYDTKSSDNTLYPKPVGTFLLRLSINTGRLIISYLADYQRVKNLFLTRLYNGLYQIDESDIHQPIQLINGLIKPWTKLKYVYMPTSQRVSGTIKKKDLFGDTRYLQNKNNINSRHHKGGQAMIFKHHFLNNYEPTATVPVVNNNDEYAAISAPIPKMKGHKRQNDVSGYIGYVHDNDLNRANWQKIDESEPNLMTATFKTEDDAINLSSATRATKIWLKSTPSLNDLYPNLMLEFQHLTKCNVRKPTLQQIELFFVRYGGSYNTNNSIPFITLDKFNKFFAWFESMCYIIKDLRSIYERLEDPLIALFYGRNTTQQILESKPEGTFVLRLATQKNGLAITYKNSNGKIQNVLLTRIGNELYKVGKSNKETVIFNLIRPWPKLKYLYTPNKLIRKKFLF